jgi:hypothetical protein
MRNLQSTTFVSLLIIGCCLLFVTSSNVVAAQNAAESRAATLRAQLAQVQQQQDQLQTRLRQLDEDLKPENIEKTLAGVGSTHPEDLRAQRRRQLEIEKTSVQTKLDLLATSRTRLETGIAQADADAYRQSASPNTRTQQSSTGQTAAPNSTNRRRKRRTNRKKSKPRRVSQSKLLSADFPDSTD